MCVGGGGGGGSCRANNYIGGGGGGYIVPICGGSCTEVMSSMFVGHLKSVGLQWTGSMPATILL